jgi:glycosyltransferase involved in cell wall biosynthesis
MHKVLLSSNEPRARSLFAELGRYFQVVGHEDFDEIDPVTKYTAAALSFRRPRRSWWLAYQMHPLLQRRRRAVLQKKMRRYDGQIDALLMWGSWFHPTKGAERSVPFFQYIDESLSPPAAGTGIPDFTYRRSFRLQGEAYADCSGIFCMSAWARDQTLAGFPECADKLHVVGWGPCGVDLSDENIDETTRRPIVLHVSNDFERKGVDFLVRTAEIVRSTLPQAEFIVIGRPGQFDVGVGGEAVRFLGPINDKQELSRYFREASLFFLPHRYDRSPHVLVEAMSAGLPLVASRQGGCIELIENQGTGWLIPIGDVQGYARAISMLLTDARMRTRMGAAARDLMRRKYNWDRVAQEIAAVMRRRLGKRDGVGRPNRARPPSQ